MKKLFQKTLIFILIFAWIFSGFPPSIFEKPQEAHAATCEYRDSRRDDFRNRDFLLSPAHRVYPSGFKPDAIQHQSRERHESKGESRADYHTSKRRPAFVDANPD